jgi:hypothetical protein
MAASPITVDVGQISVLLRGEPEPINHWITRWSGLRAALYVAVIVVGTGLYGAAMGCWRSSLQGLYTAAKLPMIILLTTVGNAMLNAMLAPLLGINLGFRQTLSAVLMSFTISAAILGAFSPVMFFFVWSAPPMSPQAWTGYAGILLAHVGMIAVAGTAGNARLLQLLVRLAGNAGVARRVLWAWLAGNCLLGTQLSWILRPFVGSPNLPVQFLRAHPFDGNFFESVLAALRRLTFD